VATVDDTGFIGAIVGAGDRERVRVKFMKNNEMDKASILIERIESLVQYFFLTDAA